MTRLRIIVGALALVAAFSQPGVISAADSKATFVFDQKTLDQWLQVGPSRWRIVDGLAVADRGEGGFLVTKDRYSDCYIRAELWTDPDVNSGIMIRWRDPFGDLSKLDLASLYEINIFDKTPRPTYGTGAISRIASSAKKIIAAGKWNVVEITAKGPHLVVKFNGETTVDVQDSTLQNGYIALQYGGSGAVKLRSFEIEPL